MKISQLWKQLSRFAILEERSALLGDPQLKKSPHDLNLPHQSFLFPLHSQQPPFPIHNPSAFNHLQHILHYVAYHPPLRIFLFGDIYLLFANVLFKHLVPRIIAALPSPLACIDAVVTTFTS
jgi:hypothetical protein